MNSTKDENHGAVAGQVDCRVRPLVERLDAMATGWLCAGLPDAELPAEAAREIERLRECLAIWIADGSLQTFEHRERFRAEARALLAA